MCNSGVVCNTQVCVMRLVLQCCGQYVVFASYSRFQLLPPDFSLGRKGTECLSLPCLCIASPQTLVHPWILGNLRPQANVLGIWEKEISDLKRGRKYPNIYGTVGHPGQRYSGCDVPNT